MKYLQVVCVVGALLIDSNCFAGVVGTLYVSGSSVPLVNGTYTYAGISNTKASWVKGDYAIQWSYIQMSDEWNIENTAPSGEVLYTDWSKGSLPAETEWTCQSLQVMPCTPPVVTQTPLPDKLIVSGTADTFLNGTFTRGENYNGYPRYVMGDYEIRQGTAFMSIDWSIESATESFQYYTHAGIGVDVPEQGWLASFSGTPTSPPVVTETKLPEQYRVSGAGLSGANGIYTRTDNSVYHTGLVYEKGTSYILSAGGVGPMVLGYEIASNGGNSYYYVESDSLLIPSSGWAVNTFPENYPPPPFVAPYNFPWPIFLSPVVQQGENN